MNDRLRTCLIVIGIAALYGLVCRLAFTAEPLEQWLRIVSVSFIYLAPASIGALVCFVGSKLDRPTDFWAVIAPAITMAILLFGSILFKLEAFLCALVASPIAIAMASTGGWLMSLVLKRINRDRLPLSLAVLLPFAVSPIEQIWEAPHETRSMRNAVTIHASPETIWQHIQQVEAIKPDELPNQWIYLLDFPRPIAATLDKPGVGGRRLATFERNVSFFEVVTEWQPFERLSFTIEADPAFVPHTAFDQHIIVGGRFYDVLDGTYEIEPLQGGKCILHLSSTHRLSTQFNWYTGWWSEWVMNQIQGSILEVIRKRCETPPSDQS